MKAKRLFLYMKDGTTKVYSLAGMNEDEIKEMEEIYSGTDGFGLGNSQWEEENDWSDIDQFAIR